MFVFTPLLKMMLTIGDQLLLCLFSNLVISILLPLVSCLNVPTSWDLKLTESAVLRLLTSSFITAGNSLQFPFKPKNFALDVVASLVHKISKSSDTSTKPVRCVFLDCSCLFNSVPLCLIFPKPEQSGHPNRLLARLPDYFTSKTQCTRVD